MKFISVLALTALMGLSSAAAVEKRGLGISASLSGGSEVESSWSSSAGGSASGSGSVSGSSSASGSGSVSGSVSVAGSGSVSGSVSGGSSAGYTSIDQCNDAYTLVESVHAQVFALTGSINSTCNGLTTASASGELSSALSLTKSHFTSITALISLAQSHCARIGAGVELVDGHSTAELSNLLAAVLVEVEFTASASITLFGYWEMFGCLHSVQVALAGLVSGVGCIVGGLLVLLTATLKISLCAGVSVVLGGVLSSMAWIL